MSFPMGSDHEVYPERQTTPTTPRRSAAVRRPHDTSTPRKTSANKTRTPNSAPVRVRSGAKKQEPTLLGDFLLGRPSPSRVQRKSLDVGRPEIRAGSINKLQAPGGVRERVKQWQKDNAAMMIHDIPTPFDEPSDRLVDEENTGLNEDDRMRTTKGLDRLEKPQREERRDISPDSEFAKSAPRKRVVSDDHWMKRTTDASLQKPTMRRSPGTAAKIPKDFVKSNSLNPSLESKIDDWAKRVYTEPGSFVEQSSRGAREEIVPSQESANSRSTKESAFDDGIRVKPLDRDHTAETEIYAQRPKETPSDDDMWKTTTKEMRRRTKETGVKKERKSSYEYYEPPLTDISESNIERRAATTLKSEAFEDEPSISRNHESPTRKSKSRRKTSANITGPLPDIPVGSSAFSVLGMPVGGDAGTLKTSKPQRNPSFSAVPKVLKKVYNEGLKIVHDTVDPPRSGQNQPQSIESWLNSTSDPFIHDDQVPENIPENGKPHQPSSRSSTNGRREEVPTKMDYHETSRTERRARNLEGDDIFHGSSSLGGADSDEPNVQAPSEPAIYGSGSPSNLRRSPARRTPSSPIKSPSRIPSRGVSPRTTSHGYETRTNLESPYSLSERNELNPSSSRERCVLDDSQNDKSGLQVSLENIGGQGDLKQSAQHSNTTTVDGGSPKPSIPRRPLRREPPSTGVHQLSTIASVETLTTEFSQLKTLSDLSQTTCTQPTSTESCIESNEPGVVRQRSSRSGLKRRLTKHSDLMSLLSLPDTSIPGRSRSIRSARSVRTTRSRLDTATFEDLMREVADDEVKYMRELKTLVDGVIPVLLTSVLSKSESVASTGLFDISSGEEPDASITKPIVDMGIALERLKSLHKRIPLEDLAQFSQWAYSAHKIYDDYLRAWRMGFQDIVVNLAPASSLPSQDSDSMLDGMPRNADGDVVNADGERVDVAFLLKRPLVRIKYLAKATKGVRRLDSSKTMEKVDELFQELLIKVRRRTEEEKGRQEDISASKTDSTRARDLRTLSPLDGVKVDRSRQVRAKDYFEFDLHHSSGQRMVCQVELLLRDKPDDAGDILVCEVDARKDRWLLIAPVELHQISARKNDSNGQLVVMIRGTQASREWRELFVLTAENDAIATEWVQMLGSSPLPPPLKDDLSPSDQHMSPAIDAGGVFLSATLQPEAVEIPIGEKRTSDHISLQSNSHTRRKPLPTNRSISTPAKRDHGNGSTPGGSASSTTKLDSNYETLETRRNRSHSEVSHPSNGKESVAFFDSDRTPTQGQSLGTNCKSTPRNYETSRHQSRERSPGSPELDMPFIPKQRQSYPSFSDNNNRRSTSTSGNNNFDLYAQKEDVPDESIGIRTPRDDGAPVPPPHRSPSSVNVTPKKAPLLASITSKFRNRRSSSPLKHEYQPSDASATSSASESEYSDESPDSGSDSSDDELEAPELSPQRPRSGPNNGSAQSTPLNAVAPALASNNSGSQVLYAGIATPPRSGHPVKLVAAISCWSEKGHWDELYPEDCSIVVSAGLIEAFIMSASHSAPSFGVNVPDPSRSSSFHSDAGNVERPLVAQVLTPVVPLRQSTALDIEIRSPLLASSRLKSTDCVRFRTRTLEDCRALYAAIHRARLENPEYKRLEQERMLNSYGGQSYQAAIGGNRRRSWFGRQKSYRASTRAPSATTSDESSKSFTAAILGRLRSGSGFNIEQSSIGTSHGPSLGPGSNGTSVYASSSDTSGTTPPRTPSNPSIATTGATNTALFKTSDLKIRLYFLETVSKWADLGAARLTVTQPPPGMRQASSLYQGVEKRIIVSRKHTTKRKLNRNSLSFNSDKIQNDEDEDSVILLDVVLGARCFSRQGVVGIAMNIWEDIVGDNGEVGHIRAVGGVSGTTRKYMFQCSNAAQAMWIYTLVGGGGRG